MQFPVDIPIGSVHLPLHAVLESLGIFVGFRYFLYLRRRSGDPIGSSNRVWIIIGAIFGALVGSRLVGALEDPVAWGQSAHPVLYFYQHKTVVGGFLGGLAGVELMKKYIGENKASGDLFVYPMILALIIGRVGCFSMGVHEETYGVVTRYPWGLDLGDGLSRHPVALYEIGVLVLLWAGLKLVDKSMALQTGALFKLFMMAYVGFRFVLDFIKPHYTYGFGLSTIQVTCLLGLLYYSPYLLHPKKLIRTVYA